MNRDETVFCQENYIDGYFINGRVDPVRRVQDQTLYCRIIGNPLGVGMPIACWASMLAH